MKKYMSFFCQFLRVKEWYQSKIPFAMCYLWFVYMQRGIEDMEQFVAVNILSMLFLGCFLAFSYMINDFSDIEVDKSAGKEKVICSQSKAAVIGWLIGLFLGGCVPLLCYQRWDAALGVMLLLTYFLGYAYSMKPFRFKERGLIGLVECSVAQRCMPIGVIWMLIGGGRSIFLLFLLISFFMGLRYIFIHQLIDIENDRKSGVNTYAMCHYWVSCVGVYVMFAAEVILLAFLCSMIARPKLFVMIPIVLILEYLQGRNVQKCIVANPFLTFYNVPLEGFYNIYFLVFIMICMVPDSPWVLLCLGVAVLYLAAPFWAKFRMIIILFRNGRLKE